MKPLSVALILEKQSFRDQVMEALANIPVRVVLDQGGFSAWHLVREKLERLRPDVILMDLGDQPEQRFSYLQVIRGKDRSPAVAVIHDASDVQIILSAMRAGATEFLTVPLDRGALAAALERISALLPAGPSAGGSGGRLLAFLAAKGGAGATTLACNVAAALGKTTGQEVLLADLDMETGNVAFAVKAGSHFSILDACRNISRLDVHFWRGLVSNGLPGLHVLSAPINMRGFEHPQPVEIRQVLSFARTLYHFSVVDLSSSLSPLTMAVLEDTDQTFLITTSDLPSLHLAKRTLQKLSQTGYPPERLGLVLNRASRRDEVSGEDIERNLGIRIFWSFPNDVKSVTDFYIQGGSVGAKSDLGKSVGQFVTKIAEPPPSPGSKKASFRGL